MVKYKRTSERHSQLKNVYLIEDKVTLRYIYRYIPLATLTQSIEFKEPSQWWDEFEKRFYCAEYNQQKYPGYPKKLFALCTTAKRGSEAGWKMYKHTEDPLIQIKINRKKFIEALSLYYKNKDVAIYEGKVNYDIKEAHISILHMPSYTRTIKEVENFHIKLSDHLLELNKKGCYLLERIYSCWHFQFYPNDCAQPYFNFIIKVKLDKLNIKSYKEIEFDLMPLEDNTQ